MYLKTLQNALRNPRKTLELGAKFGRALTSRKRKSVLSPLLNVMKIYHTSKGN